MNKVIKIVLIVIGLVAAGLWFAMPDQDDPNAINNSAMNFMFIIMYALLAIAVVASVFFGLKKLLSTPGSLKKTLFTLGGLAIVVVVSYGLSSGEEAKIIADAMADKGATESTVKNIGMGLNVFFILTAVAVVLMVVPSLKKMFVK